MSSSSIPRRVTLEFKDDDEFIQKVNAKAKTCESNYITLNIHSQ